MTAVRRIDDLGVMSDANFWKQWRVMRDPRTSREVAMGQAMHGGFVLADPATGEVTAVPQEEELPHTWASTQAPDGRIYQASVYSQAGDPPLLAWDGRSPMARVVARMKCRAVFAMDAAPDNRVYLPDYHSRLLYGFHPDASSVEPVCGYSHLPGHPRNVAVGLDGCVYVVLAHHETPLLTVWNPARGGEPIPVPEDPSFRWIPGSLIKDSDHRIWARGRMPGGTIEWRELVGGRGVETGRPRVTPEGQPWWFRDGSRILSVQGEIVTFLRSDGRTLCLNVPLPRVPLRLFSVASGGRWLWGSTIIPLTLFRYDPSTGQKENYPNPTETDGEIYSMVWTSQRLFMASYYGAHLARFDPSCPWHPGARPDDNPRFLGPMKDPPLLLQRPYGRATDRQGRVFFAALGGYGCEDSGISRITPEGETVERWLYPRTTLGPIAYLERDHVLLGGEVRKGESMLRFTFSRPRTDGCSNRFR